MKTATRCPGWCAGGHQCTARLSGGTHASRPERWESDKGGLVATRYDGPGGSYLELRLNLRLPDGEGPARLAAIQMLNEALSLITQTVPHQQ